MGKTLSTCDAYGDHQRDYFSIIDGRVRNDGSQTLPFCLIPNQRQARSKSVIRGSVFELPEDASLVLHTTKYKERYSNVLTHASMFKRVVKYRVDVPSIRSSVIHGRSPKKQALVPMVLRAG